MEIGHRLWSWLRRDARARELEEEMKLHLELKVQEQITRGASQEEARHRAQIDFGNANLAAERSRERWGFVQLEDIRRDIAYGVRQFVRNPGFTAIVVLTLALGIGANSAIFSVVNAFLLKSLPVNHPEELVKIGIQPSGEFDQNAYEFLRDHQKTLAGLIAWDDGLCLGHYQSRPTNCPQIVPHLLGNHEVHAIEPPHPVVLGSLRWIVSTRAMGSVKRLIGGNGCRGTVLIAIAAEGFGAARRIKPLPEVTPRDI